MAHFPSDTFTPCMSPGVHVRGAGIGWNIVDARHCREVDYAGMRQMGGHYFPLRNTWHSVDRRILTKYRNRLLVRVLSRFHISPADRF